MELVLSAYARPDLLGQAVAKEEAELGRGSAAMRMEPDPDSHGGEGVARYPMAVDSWGVSVSLPRFHPQGTPGGQLGERLVNKQSVLKFDRVSHREPPFRS
jgi:hypothetical protein